MKVIKDSLGPHKESRMMTKEDLFKEIRKSLKTNVDLDFLLKLTPRELEILLVCLRDMLDQERR
jgi:hypothetical protein